MSSFAILLKTTFFKHEFAPMKGKVSPRPFSSLSFRLSGKVSISATEANFVSEGNTITFIPRGCPYETEILEGGEMFVLHFWTESASPLFAQKPICIRVPHPDVFINLFERALRHSQAEQNPYAPMADAYRILSEAQALLIPPSQAPNAKMIACKQFLDERVLDPELRISSLAAQYGCSEVYFRAEFKRCYGCSPIEYVKKRRLDNACRLLQTNLYSVTEVALRSGFDSTSYFSSEFRRAMGCTPRDYQNT